ncbi:IniB N-terminal domain-containing protein [Actinophytocola sediminis]
MYSFHTLHDFVLNLINDDVAKAAYAADPVGALSDAGLGDLTPQDVEEVIPLVTDALPTDLPLVGDLVDLDVTNLANIDGDTTGLSALGEVQDLAYVGGLVNQDADGSDLWAGVQSVGGRVAGVAQVDDGLAEGGLSTPVAYVGGNSNGDYLVTTADPADLLDDLAGATNSAVGTATTLVGTGAGALTGAVDTGADTLAGFLAGTPVAAAVETGADTLNQVIGTTAGTATQAVDTLPVSDGLAVPLAGTDALPVALPALPDIDGRLGEVPNVSDLDLPAQLPELPVELPDLGVDTSSVTNVVSPVADVVSSSPVGGLTDTVTGVTDDLPVVGDLTDSLSLGL